MKWSVRSVICGRETKIFIPNHFMVSAQKHGALKQPLIWPSKVSASQSSVDAVVDDRRVACGLFARTSTASERRELSPNRRAITPPTRPHCMRRCGGPGKASAHSASLIASPLTHRFARLAPADAEENKAVPVSRVLKSRNRKEHGVMRYITVRAGKSDFLFSLRTPPFLLVENNGPCASTHMHI